MATKKKQVGPITLYQGDALKVLQALPDEMFDALVTDPPYSSGGQFRSDRMAGTAVKYVNTGTKNVREDFYGDNRDQRGYLMWMTMWLLEAWRTLKPGAPICLFSDWRQYPVVTDALQAAGFIWKGTAVWDKTQGVRPHKGRFRAQAEFIIWGSKGPMVKPTSASKVIPGVITCSPQKGPKLHQVGKPEELMRHVLQIAPSGSHILEPFAGSSTTLLEAARAGFAGTGIELSAHYWNVSVDRLVAARKAERW